MSTSPIPSAAPDGLYWYMVPGQEPEPVLVNRSRYGDRFKAFNGREQAWLREGERLLGPVLPPAAAPLLQVDELMDAIQRSGTDPHYPHRKVNTAV